MSILYSVYFKKFLPNYLPGSFFMAVARHGAMRAIAPAGGLALFFIPHDRAERGADDGEHRRKGDYRHPIFSQPFAHDDSPFKRIPPGERLQRLPPRVFQ